MVKKPTKTTTVGESRLAPARVRKQPAKAKPTSTTARGQTKSTINIDDSAFINPKLDFQVVVDIVAPSKLNLYKELYIKAKAANKKFVIFATPKLRLLLAEAGKKKINSWLNEITIRNYPNSERLANNVARGVVYPYVVFMSETGRYHGTIAKTFQVTGERAIFVRNAKMIETSKPDGKKKAVTPKSDGYGGLDIENKVKAFKATHGSSANKRTIDAFVKLMTNAFSKCLNDLLWEEGVYGQSEKHVEVYKLTDACIPKYSNKL